MTQPFEPYPLERYPLSALKHEARDSRREADLYRQAAARADLHAAVFEAEIARRLTAASEATKETNNG